MRKSEALKKGREFAEYFADYMSEVNPNLHDDLDNTQVTVTKFWDGGWWHPCRIYLVTISITLSQYRRDPQQLQATAEQRLTVFLKQRGRPNRTRFLVQIKGAEHVIVEFQPARQSEQTGSDRLGRHGM